MDLSDNRTRRRGMGRFDPAATAAAAALAIVAWSETLHPFGNDRWRIWVDVVVDEWLIWFTALYLAAVGGTALAARLAAWRNPSKHEPHEARPE